MIYTTYLANLKNLPEKGYKILITRWRPRQDSFMKRDNVLWRPNLSPTDYILSQYKNKVINWSEFKEKYTNQYYNNELFKEGIEEIINYVNDGEDVYLICYEKEDLYCHRSILREILESRGYKTKEYKKGNING